MPEIDQSTNTEKLMHIFAVLINRLQEDGK